MKKTAIVTGCSGMTGSWMCDLLLQKDYKVYGLMRRSSNPSNVNIKHLFNNPDFEIVQGDITDASSVTNAIQKIKPDRCFNFAGQSQVGVSFFEPTHTFKVNAEGVINILEAIRLFSPATRLYQASTSEMFGSCYDTRIIGQRQDNCGGMVTIVEKYQNEDTKMRPQSPYASAKLAAHTMVNAYRNGYNLFGCCGILFNHEGTRRSKQFATRKITSYIGELVTAPDISKHPKLKIGNVKASRDWGDARDYSRAAYLMLEQSTPDDYVVATGITRTVEQLLETAFGYVNLNWKDHTEIDPSLYRPAEVDFLRGDSSKARHLLAWAPEISFEQMIKEMIDHDILLAKKELS